MVSHSGEKKMKRGGCSQPEVLITRKHVVGESEAVTSDVLEVRSEGDEWRWTIIDKYQRPHPPPDSIGKAINRHPQA